MQVDITEIQLPDWGWHIDDPEEIAKLTTSLHRHGQIQTLLVRQLDEGGFEVIDGRRRLNIMRQMGLKWVQVHNVGPVTVAHAIHYALSLELMAEVDYVRLASQVQQLREEVVFDSLPMTTPFSRERLKYFSELLTWDWSQYDATDTQSMLFEDEDAPPKIAPVKTPDAPKPVKPAAAPRTAQPPAQATNGAAARAALRASVQLDAPAPVANLPCVELPLIDAPEPERLTQQTSVVMMGEDYSLPQNLDWRPEAPPVLDGIDEIELDCETNGLKWWDGHRPIGMSIRRPDGKKQYLPWAHKGGGNLDEAVVKRWAQRELRGKHITNANVRFDNHMLYAWGVDLEAQDCTLADVQHYAALLDEYRTEYGLSILGRDFLGISKIGQELDKTKMAEYHAGQVAEYANHDVELVGQLKHVLLPMMVEQDLGRVSYIESQVIYPVCEMERNAAHVNRTKLKEWVEQSAKELQDLLFDMAREVGFQMNPDKNADWQRLFAALGLQIPGYTDKGAPSFADALLEKIPHSAVQRGRRIKSLSSLRSKFLVSYDKVVGQDQKLRFSLHQLRGDEYGTARGRFSMSGASKGIGQFGANLQQVFRVNSQREAFGFDADDSSHDHEIYMVRALFEAEQLPGDPFPRQALSADAQSIEYRLAVHFADSKLQEAYQADVQQLAEGRLTDKWVDFHGVVGSFIAPHKKVTRNIVKNLNFCLVYGGSDDTAARTLGMDKADSQPIVDIWRRSFPEFKTLQRKATKLAEGRGFVRTLSGRRARFPDKTFAHAAINYVIQGSAADIMKIKLVELHKERKYTGLLMRQTVHDEVDGDTTTPETEARVREVLNRQTFTDWGFDNLKVPIVWEVATGPNWAVAH